MSQFVEIREPGSGWLLARYDPKRDLLEIQRRGVKTVVDLSSVKEQKPDPPKRVGLDKS
jgi:PAB1-binding protein PBP1